jgi:hypothetical protein
MASSTVLFHHQELYIIGTELITYTGNSGGTLSGLTRGAVGTTAASTFISGATVTDASNFFCMECCSIRRYCNSSWTLVTR